MDIKKILSLIVLCCIPLLASCNLPSSTSNMDADAAASTLAAETVVARLTEIANPGGEGDQTPQPTLPLPTNTLVPTAQPTSTNTPAPTNTPNPTATSLPCHWAQFIQDITVADGAQFTTGEKFVKVWRLKNIGACTWTKDYDIVFDEGDKLSGSTTSMPKNVSPGETVDIAIEMQAPNGKGTYKGYWRLRDDSGDLFGIGPGTDESFWVQIKAVTSPDYQYNLAANFCDATWRSDDGKMYCQGAGYDSKSYVQFTNSLTMEGGTKDDEAALIIQVAEDDRVRGTYPAYTVGPGEHFLARVGCVDDSKDCHVKISLRYRIKGTDDEIELGEWIEKNDNDVTLIDIDLSSLDGEEVIFVLDVSHRGDSDDNRMFWFVPSIQIP